MRIRCKFLPEIIIIIFAILIQCRFFNFISKLVSDAGLLIIGAVSIMMGIVYDKKRIFLMSSFIYLYTIFFIISYLYNQNADFIEILWPIAFMGIGSVLFVFDISPKVTNIIYIIIIILSIGISVYFKEEIATNRTPALLGTSAALYMLNVFVILFFSIHMIASFKRKIDFSVGYPLLMILALCLLVARSGVGVAILSFYFVFMFSFKKGTAIKRKHKWKFLVSSCILAVIIYAIYPEILGNIIFDIDRRNISSVRWWIWTDYLEVVVKDFLNIIFGARIEGSYWLDVYHENMVNSFFMLHAKYGLLGICLICILIGKTIFRMISYKNIYLLYPLVLLLFRTQFDYLNFNSYFDVILLYYLLYGLCSEGKMRDERS